MRQALCILGSLGYSQKNWVGGDPGQCHEGDNWKSEAKQVMPQ